MKSAKERLLSVALGNKGFTTLKACETIDGSAVEIPIFVINGVNPGPTLYLGAAVHGRELIGVETIRRIYGKLDPKELSGTIIAAPAQNILAVRARTYVTPFDDATHGNMWRVFPGKPDGSLTERMAYVLYKEAISKADYVIDIHSGIRARNKSILIPSKPEEIAKKAEEIAKAFGLKFIARLSVGWSWQESTVPRITVEIGESDRFEEEFVSIGVRGVMNVMKHLGMVEGKLEGLPDEYVISKKLYGTYFRASHGGIYIPEVKLGDKVSKGDLVARVYNLYTFEKTDEIRATEDGYIIRVMVPSLISEGDRVISIVTI